MAGFFVGFGVCLYILLYSWGYELLNSCERFLSCSQIM